MPVAADVPMKRGYCGYAQSGFDAVAVYGGNAWLSVSVSCDGGAVPFSDQFSSTVSQSMRPGMP